LRRDLGQRPVLVFFGPQTKCFGFGDATMARPMNFGGAQNATMMVAGESDAMPNR
jgi:hypothetical protein